MDVKEFLHEVRGPRDYHLAELLVVNPYPVAEFFTAIAKGLRPKRCVLVVDDGWPQVRLDGVIDTLRRRKVVVTIRRVTPIDRCGLVHAKLYLFVWKNQQGTKRSRRLYFGSPNASPQGFGQHAEVLAEVSFKHLAADVRKAASAYFDALATGSAKTAGVSLTAADGVRLWLPAICSATEGAPSFDSWVRAGRLCHRYTPDTSFGKLTVKLRKPLPKTDDEDVFASHGFVRETRRELLQRSYAGSIDVTEDSPQWRAKYFTETDYGDWTSNDCFAAQLEGELTASSRPVTFLAQGTKERSAVLAAVRDAKDHDHERWISDFGQALAKVAAQMAPRDLDPEEYLFVKSGSLILSKYAPLWRKKLQSDRARARIPEFCKRMEAGFAFPLVPPLGPDYQEFVYGLSATLLRGARLLRRRNALARVVGDVIGVDRLAEVDGGQEMYDTLVELWEDPSCRMRIQRFYVDDTTSDDD